jgi:hypothetical protein
MGANRTVITTTLKSHADLTFPQKISLNMKPIPNKIININRAFLPLRTPLC